MYNGYKIPKNTTVLVNAWYVLLRLFYNVLTTAWIGPFLKTQAFIPIQLSFVPRDSWVKSRNSIHVNMLLGEGET